MPVKSQKQFRFMKAVENNPEFADKVGVPQSVGEEMTKGNVGKKAYKKLPFEKLRSKLKKSKK